MQEHFYKHFESERHSGFRDDISVIYLIKLMAPTVLKEKHTGCQPWKLQHPMV